MATSNESKRLRIALIMAGGAGERFWPLSRSHKPKQLLKLTHPTKTLLDEAVERIEPLVGKEHIFIATTQILQTAIRNANLVDKSHVYAEPVRRNTLGGIAWATANLIAEHPDRWEEITLCVLLSDHKISPPEAFRDTVQIAIRIAEESHQIVTIGIPPTRADSGFGYIEKGKALDEKGAFHVDSFKEKPSRDLAHEYVSQGRFYWNSGMLFFNLATFMHELEEVNPDCKLRIQRIADWLLNGNVEEAEDEFAQIPNISIDYALLEKTQNVGVVESSFSWDDIGSLDALDRSLPLDDEGNVCQGRVVTHTTSNSIVYNDNPESVVCTLGVHGMIVIATKDAVFVCPKNEVQNLRDVTARIMEFDPKHL